MKIKNYILETQKMIEELDNLKYEDGEDSSKCIRAYDLFNAIEFREMDVHTWFAFGKTEEDDVPEVSKKLLNISWQRK